ncbi:WD40 repeat-like protein [Ascodesmis nigricans]|uniref:DNA damage-binding protein CMR1 n=1 Tax=Ascodesmis nigricans TaxID=341454 RepID=A0A4S2MX30_9PEZI|nr:WD40 repeat-like protein [Ascodesmis nigricans]
MEESEYEKQRRKNILANQALLAELALTSPAGPLLSSSAGGAKSNRAKSSSSPGAPAKRAPRPKPKKEPTEHVPRRTSSRLAGIPADSELAKKKRKAEDDEAVRVEREKEKKKQRIDERMKFVVPDLGWEGAKIVVRDEEEELKLEDEEDVKEEGSEDGEEKGINRIRARLGRLKLWEEFPVADLKITQERIYHMEFHPSRDKPLIFAGDKIGNLGILDASPSAAIKKDDDNDEEDTDTSTPSITNIKLHTRTLPSFTFSPTTPSTLLSASYDGSIRSLDLNTGESTQLYALEDTGEGLSSLSVLPDNTIVFSSLSGLVGHVDPRAPANTRTWECSEKKIGHISAHPAAGRILATASLDRTVKLWDLRHMSSPIAEHESRLSVSSANISQNGEVVTTSYDDTIKIYDPELKVKTVVRHSNQTGRWVTIFKAKWWRTERVVIASMNRWIDVYNREGELLGQVGRDEEQITAVPAAVAAHAGREWVVGGTGSGKVTLFM